jgi:hypothetical protein
MGFTILRGLLIGGGLLLALGGLGVIAIDRAAFLPGLWAVVSGMVVIVAVLLERQRYRSSAAELGAEAPGPGGGEPLDGGLESRFRPTSEQFVDPTTRQRMRVWLDPASGERRYRADG